MITRQHRKTVLDRLWMPMLVAACIGYFGLSSYGGAYGLRAMDTLKAERLELEQRLAALRDQRRGLETRIAAVRPESLDAEVVDMRAREALNLIRDDEIQLHSVALQ